MEKMKMQSKSNADNAIDLLRRLFPQVIVESSDGENIKSSIDFEQLKAELSDNLCEDSVEKFQLNWPGKRNALLNANTPTTKSLNPIRSESVDFSTTKNVFIEGDNLDVLKVLQESYLNKVKLIYIDPPYNTGNDFIYRDDYFGDEEEYLINSMQVDKSSNRLVPNLESNGRFHSDWLSMMYSRLKLARNLLRDDGIIFISIGDDEQANLKKLCDEIFGVANFLGCACRVSKKANNQGEFWSPNYDYLLTYAKERDKCPSFFGGVNYSNYDQVDSDGPRAGEKYQLVRLYMTSLDPMRGCTNQRYFIEAPDGTLLIPPGNNFPKEKIDAASIAPETGEDKVWRWTKDSYLKQKDKIFIKKVRSSNLVDDAGGEVKWNVFTKTYLNDVIQNSTAKPNSLIEDHINQNSSHELGDLEIPFSFAKPSSLIKYLCEISKVENDDIVLDFFAGSGSTAHGVMSYNIENNKSARFILVQLPEVLRADDKNHKAGYIFCEKNNLPKNIAEITKERLRRAGKAITASTDLISQSNTQPLDIGFRVLRLAESNMADVYYNPDAVSQDLLSDQADNVKADRTPEDLLFQVLLDWGVDLSLPIQKDSILGKDVFFVDQNALAACFDSKGGVDEEFVKELAKRQPLRVVFRDAGFKSDSVKINVEQIFKLVSPSTEVKCI